MTGTRIRGLHGVLIAAVFVGSVMGPAAADGPKRLSDYDLPGLDAMVNLDSLDSWDVVQLIEFLAYRGGLKNIVIGNGVSGLTTKLKFENVTVADALEVVLSVNQLAYEINSGIMTIMTDEEYLSKYGRSFNDQKQVKVVELKYADAAHVAEMLTPLKSPIGTVVSDAVTASLILIDTPGKLAEMEAVIARADIKTISRVMATETESFVLQYAEMDDIRGGVETILSKEAGSLHTDRRTKTLIVTDLPHNMVKIKELVALFDTRPKQVFIEAKIVDVTLDDQFSMGINWDYVFEGLDPRFQVGAISGPAMPTTPIGTLSYRTIMAGEELNMVLQALRTVGETKVLSNPQIAVLDGQEATFEVVEDQPYKEVTLESGTTNITGVTYLFKKVGVQLNVTPRINDDRFISVLVKPEVSQITQWYDGPPQEGTPVIRKSLTETTVLVRDGVTIIIGGLIKDEKSEFTEQVPLLGSIPILGALFRTKGESVVKRETVVFLTPRLISGEEPYLRMRDEKKQPRPMRTVGDRPQGKQLKALR